MKINLK